MASEPRRVVATAHTPVLSDGGVVSAPPAHAPPAHTLIVGCGNILRGDDAVGPVLVRRLWELGLPDGVRCADGGTGGMDVAFQMRGVPHVILVDACTSGSEPGAMFRMPGHEVEQLPPVTGINLHAFRWDHALAFARWLLKDEYPAKVTVYLIEAAQFTPCEGLSPAVAESMETLCQLLLAEQGTLESGV